MVGQSCRSVHYETFSVRLSFTMTNEMAVGPFCEPERRTPAKGVHVSLGGPNWDLLTVCTEGRGRWLAETSVQRAPHEVWEHTATAWLVSDDLLMPDRPTGQSGRPAQTRKLFHVGVLCGWR